MICVDRYGREKAEGNRLQIEMTDGSEGLGRIKLNVYLNVRPRGDGTYAWESFGAIMQLREFFRQLGITKEDCERAFG